MIVSPPKMIGTRSVARMFGLTPYQVRVNVRAGNPIYHTGYVGKISGRHVWNAPELIVALFTADADVEQLVDRLTARTVADPTDTILCTAPGCDEIEEMVGLCRRHLRRLMTAWRRSAASTLTTVQLVAMCRWVADRNAHLVLPAGYDPFAPVCMTPGCDNEARANVLCTGCAAQFWSNMQERARPAHWKVTA